jgi:TonB family protein
MIKAAIVLLAAHLVLPRLRRQSAAERHALWAAILAIAACLPVLTSLLPSWEPAWVQRAADTWPVAFDRGSSLANAGDIVVRATGIEPGRWTLAAVLALLWTTGALVSLIVFGVQAVRLKRLAGAGSVAHPRHAAIANRVADSLGLKMPVVLVSARIHIPLAWGLTRPHLLLPRASHDWPDERVWAVCAHEMAHISRGDWIVHLLAECVCRIYWFNPLFWMARNHLGRESERAADDVAIELGASASEYASHLIDIVRAARSETGLAASVAMARLRDGRFGASRGSGLERRVAALLDALVNRTRMTRGRAIAILAGACIIAGPLAALGAHTGATIEIHTSNLPPIDETVARGGLAGDDSEAVRDIRVLEPIAAGRDVPPSVSEYTTPPLYSDQARRSGIEGVVIAQARIDASGRVSRSRIVRGLGAGLDQNALVALRQWQFAAGTRNGTAVSMDVEIEIAFTLRNETINAQIANDMVTLVGPGITAPHAVRVVNLPQRRMPNAGTVILDVVLLEDGTPRIVRILRSLGSDADDMAVRAFEQWRFSPALKDGHPIKVRLNAAVRFHG